MSPSLSVLWPKLGQGRALALHRASLTGVAARLLGLGRERSPLHLLLGGETDVDPAFACAASHLYAAGMARNTLRTHPSRRAGGLAGLGLVVLVGGAWWSWWSWWSLLASVRLWFRFPSCRARAMRRFDTTHFAAQRAAPRRMQRFVASGPSARRAACPPARVLRQRLGSGRWGMRGSVFSRKIGLRLQVDGLRGEWERRPPRLPGVRPPAAGPVAALALPRRRAQR